MGVATSRVHLFQERKGCRENALMHDITITDPCGPSLLNQSLKDRGYELRQLLKRSIRSTTKISPELSNFFPWRSQPVMTTPPTSTRSSRSEVTYVSRDTRLELTSTLCERYASLSYAACQACLLLSMQLKGTRTWRVSYVMLFALCFHYRSTCTPGSLQTKLCVCLQRLGGLIYTTGSF